MEKRPLNGCRVALCYIQAELSRVTEELRLAEEALYMWGAHWRHLANTTEQFMCGGGLDCGLPLHDGILATQRERKMLASTCFLLALCLVRFANVVGSTSSESFLVMTCELFVFAAGGIVPGVHVITRCPRSSELGAQSLNLHLARL